MPARTVDPVSTEPEVAYKDPNELEQLAREGKLTAEEVRAQVKLGFDSLDRGDCVEISSREELDRWFDDILLEVRARIEARQRG